MKCFLCLLPMDSTDGHGLGECVDLCDVCLGEGCETCAFRGTPKIREFDARWYWCTVEDAFGTMTEPDWSRVPEDKRAAVQAKWRASNAPVDVGRWQLWGPQLPWYQMQRQYAITVHEVAE